MTLYDLLGGHNMWPDPDETKKMKLVVRRVSEHSRFSLDYREHPVIAVSCQHIPGGSYELILEI